MKGRTWPFEVLIRSQGCDMKRTAPRRWSPSVPISDREVSHTRTIFTRLREQGAPAKPTSQNTKMDYDAATTSVHDDLNLTTYWKLDATFDVSLSSCGVRSQHRSFEGLQSRVAFDNGLK